MKLEVEELPEPVFKALRDAVCEVLRAHDVKGACAFAVHVLRAQGKDHVVSSTAAAVPYPVNPAEPPANVLVHTTMMHMRCIREPAMWQTIADHAAHTARRAKGGPVQ